MTDDPDSDDPAGDTDPVNDQRNGCTPVSAVADPSAKTSFETGTTKYSLGAVPLGGVRTRVEASVWYPATSAGQNAPIAQGEKFPVVVALHGNHDNLRSRGQLSCAIDVAGALANYPNAAELPSDAGFGYLGSNLSAAGITFVSVNANDLNCQNGSFINERASLIVEHLRVLAGAPPRTGASIPATLSALRSRLALDNVGLFGHSRGAETVVVAAAGSMPSGVTVRGVMSVAPTDATSSSLQGVPMLVVLPAADGDIGDNPGAKIYDRAKKGTAGNQWFKAQHYVYGANHNFFNTEWNDTGTVNGIIKPGGDDGIDNGDNRIGAATQRKYALATTRAFFDTVFGRTPALEAVIAGDAKVQGLEGVRVWTSFTDSQTFMKFSTPPQPAGFDTFGSFSFTQTGGTPFNKSFFHGVGGYVGVWNRPTPAFTIPQTLDLSSRARIWFRVAQVVDTHNEAGADADLEVEIEDTAGQRSSIATSELGLTVPAPYARPPWRLLNSDGSTTSRDVTKTMLGTVRIPTACFTAKNAAVSLANLKTLRVRPRGAKGALAFADFQ